jgi:hypothetical protein
LYKCAINLVVKPKPVYTSRKPQIVKKTYVLRELHVSVCLSEIFKSYRAVPFYHFSPLLPSFLAPDIIWKHLDVKISLHRVILVLSLSTADKECLQQDKKAKDDASASNDAFWGLHVTQERSIYRKQTDVNLYEFQGLQHLVLSVCSIQSSDVRGEQLRWWLTRGERPAHGPLASSTK